MSTKPDGGPAFPQDSQGRRGDDPQYQGMTLRDWFAGQALAGLNANPYLWASMNVTQIIEMAWDDADEMLKEREKGAGL